MCFKSFAQANQLFMQRVGTHFIDPIYVRGKLVTCSVSHMLATFKFTYFLIGVLHRLFRNRITVAIEHSSRSEERRVGKECRGRRSPGLEYSNGLAGRR